MNIKIVDFATCVLVVQYIEKFAQTSYIARAEPGILWRATARHKQTILLILPVWSEILTRNSRPEFWIVLPRVSDGVLYAVPLIAIQFLGGRWCGPNSN